MEPIPQTKDALVQIWNEDAGDLEQRLLGMARVARSIVPDLVGLSLGLVHEGLTFTLVASDGEIAGIDAAQYLDGGPCLRGDGQDASIQMDDVEDLLRDHTWELFARASRAAGVASSLSLPVVSRGVVIGGINLYAATSGAFTGHQDALAEALGATAEGALTDADLSFSSRHRAVDTPRRLREQHDLDVAAGLLAARHRETIAQAAERLSGAAARAGVAPAVLARALLDLHTGGES